MIARLWLSFEPGTYGWHAVGIVEADQPRAVRSVQRERVGQAVRALLGRLDALDFELDPVALFQMMNASIESQKEFESLFGRSLFHIMSQHDNKVLHLPSQWPAIRSRNQQPQPEVRR